MAGPRPGAVPAGRPTPALRLAVGAVSRAAVDAAVDAAAYHSRPVYLVASRAQIGSVPSRPGYVDGWCMEDLHRDLVETGRRHHVLLARDHGGPLQHAEDGPAHRLDDAMESACAALAEDVRAGVDGVHLDLGAWTTAGGDFAKGVRRLVEACEAAAGGRRLEYEVGVEAQSPDAAEPAEVEAQLAAVSDAMPEGVDLTFLVVQCGTLVREDGNSGLLATADDRTRNRVAELGATVGRDGVLAKAHNCDYLPPWSLRALGRSGFYCNVAPQYAVVQNRLLARLLAMHADDGTAGRVADAVRSVGGWRRWTDDPDPTPSRVVELGAHYAMAHPVLAGCLAGLTGDLERANLPTFDELTRRTLVQLMLQQVAAVEGVGVPCQ